MEFLRKFRELNGKDRFLCLRSDRMSVISLFCHSARLAVAIHARRIFVRDNILAKDGQSEMELLPNSVSIGDLGLSSCKLAMSDVTALN